MTYFINHNSNRIWQVYAKSVTNKRLFSAFLGSLVILVLLTKWFHWWQSVPINFTDQNLQSNKVGFDAATSTVESDNSTNLARLDWSQSEMASFNPEKSRLTPKTAPHSRNVRVLLEKSEYAIGDVIGVVIRFDYPAGFGLDRSNVADIITPDNVTATARPAHIEGPLTFPETPQTLYYKTSLPIAEHSKIKPGKWRIQFIRVYLNVKPEEKKQEDRVQYEFFEAPVIIKRKTPNTKGKAS